MNDPRSSSVPHLLMAGLLTLLLAWVYGASVLDHGYIYDDYKLIETNPRLLSFWGPLQNWAAPLWQFPDSIESRPTGFWRPATLQVLAAAKWLSGGEAWGPHLASWVVHVLATLAAVNLALRLGFGFWSSWGLGLLFAMHPVQVQSVAWAASINDPLIGLFSLTALSAFLAWVDHAKRSRLLLAMLAFGLGLLSKEQAAGVLPVAGLMIWLWRGHSFAKAVRTTCPLAGVLLAYYGLRVYVFDSIGAGLAGAIVDFRLDTVRAFSFRLELLGSFASLLAWPVDLAFFHGVRPTIPEGDTTYPLILALGAVWLLGAITAIALGRKRTAFLLCMPLAWLAPQVWFYESAGAFPLSDRYLYMPMFGFAALVMLALGNLLQSRNTFLACVVLAIPFGLLSRSELRAYSDNETFFRHAIEESPTVPVGYWSLGRELMAQYKRDQKHEKLEEALVQYLTVLTLGRDYGARTPKLGPGDPMRERVQELSLLVHGPGARPPLGDSSIISTEDLFQANMGQSWALIAAGELPPNYDITTAIEAFEQVTKAYPHRHEAWIGLASAYFSGEDLESARVAIGKAIQANPESPEAWFNLGEIQRRQGKHGEAANSYREAQRFRPYGIKDSIARIESLIDAGQDRVAEYELTELAKEHSGDMRVPYLKGMLSAVRGQWDLALNHFDRVLAGEPNNPEAHLQRGKILVQLKRTTEAVAALGRTCEIDSTNFEAHSLIGQILMADPATEAQAREYILRAYSLGTASPARRRLQIYLLQWISDDEDALMGYMHMDQARHDWLACLWWIEQLQRLENPWPNVADRLGRMAAVQLAAGSCLKELGETEAAIAAWREGIELYDSLFWIHYNLGSLLYDLKRFNEALPVLERAMELNEQLSSKENFRGAVVQTLEAQIRFARANGPDLMGPAPVETGPQD